MRQAAVDIYHEEFLSLTQKAADAAESADWGRATELLQKAQDALDLCRDAQLNGPYFEDW